MMRCLACRAEYPYTLLVAQIGAMARRRAEEALSKAEAETSPGQPRRSPPK